MERRTIRIEIQRRLAEGTITPAAARRRLAEAGIVNIIRDGMARPIIHSPDADSQMTTLYDVRDVRRALRIPLDHVPSTYLDEDAGDLDAMLDEAADLADWIWNHRD
jgi:hypothetical protein